MFAGYNMLIQYNNNYIERENNKKQPIKKRIIIKQIRNKENKPEIIRKQKKQGNKQ